MSNPCIFTKYAENSDLFHEWYNASESYIESLPKYLERTWLVYTIYRTVGVNEYLKGKGIPPDSSNVGSSSYFYFNGAFRPQLKAYYKSVNNIPENVPENVKELCVIQAIEDLRKIIANAPRTTTPFLVFRALREKYNPAYITGFMSTGTEFNNLKLYMTPQGQYLCIRVPVGTPCIIGNGDLCEIFFSDNVKLKPIEPLGIPEIDATEGLYLEVVSPDLTGGKRKNKSRFRVQRRSRKNKRNLDIR